MEIGKKKLTLEYCRRYEASFCYYDNSIYSSVFLEIHAMNKNLLSITNTFF